MYAFSYFYIHVRIFVIFIVFLDDNSVCSNELEMENNCLIDKHSIFLLIRFFNILQVNI